jgi:hypothetical protein
MQNIKKFHGGVIRNIAYTDSKYDYFEKLAADRKICYDDLGSPIRQIGGLGKMFAG